jgi:hypothetical protein
LAFPVCSLRSSASELGTGVLGVDGDLPGPHVNGERKILPRISVEVARVAAPSQQADASNTLAVALKDQFES